jgi:hypothetical protein
MGNWSYHSTQTCIGPSPIKNINMIFDVLTVVTMKNGVRTHID